MRVIKFFAWEAPYIAKLDQIRRSELHHIRSLLGLRAFNSAVALSVPMLATVVSFLVYAATSGGFNSPAIVFTSLTLFQLLRMPLMMLPMALSTITDAHNACNRLTEVFLADEISETFSVDLESKFAIEVIDASFQWESTPPEAVVVKGKGKKGNGKGKPAVVDKLEDVAPVLQLADINLKIPRGSLTAIVGTVGAGKSSLLQALLGEMRRTKGEVVFGGSIAYCPQQSWIRNATLRENILFGQPFDEARYNQVIEDSCLTADLEMLPNGEFTEIGEKGINLSGGQKRAFLLPLVIETNDVQNESTSHAHSTTEPTRSSLTTPSPPSTRTSASTSSTTRSAVPSRIVPESSSPTPSTSSPLAISSFASTRAASRSRALTPSSLPTRRGRSRNLSSSLAGKLRKRGRKRRKSRSRRPRRRRRDRWCARRSCRRRSASWAPSRARSTRSTSRRPRDTSRSPYLSSRSCSCRPPRSSGRTGSCGGRRIFLGDRRASTYVVSSVISKSRANFNRCVDGNLRRSWYRTGDLFFFDGAHWRRSGLRGFQDAPLQRRARRDARTDELLRHHAPWSNYEQILQGHRYRRQHPQRRIPHGVLYIRVGSGGYPAHYHR